MADIHIKTKWSDDGKYVTLSKDDWEKVLLSLEKNGSVIAPDLGWACGKCGCTNLKSDLLCGFCDTPRPSR